MVSALTSMPLATVRQLVLAGASFSPAGGVKRVHDTLPKSFLSCFHPFDVTSGTCW